LKNAIIFCNRKRDVATLHRSLLRHGFSVQALHGDMDQSARTAALEQFRKNEVTLLVASDVAARGLDIPDVSHIYNFDVPIHADDYVHRIGRTGRAGRNGTAITIVAGSNDTKAVAAIEKLIGQPIPYMDKIAGKPAEPQHEPRQESRHEPRHEQRHEPRHEQRQTARPPQRGRHENQRRPQQPERRPQQPAPAPVARIEDARSRRAPQPVRKPMDDGDASPLPAFLLRPVTVKA
jgi:superfamily II DNA/RNA helicase